MYIDGFNGYSTSNYAISKNNECIYYSNIYDRNTLYRYNFVTKQYEKLLDELVYEIAISDDESLCAVKTAANGGKIINLSNGTTQDIDCANGLVFNADNELYAIYISDDEILWKQLMDGNTIDIKTITSSYSSSASYAFDSSGDNLVIVHKTSSKNARIILYKKYNGIWTEVKNFEVERASGVIDVQKNIYLTEDVSTVYISKDLAVDINSETLGSVAAGTIKYVYMKVIGRTPIQ